MLSLEQVKEKLVENQILECQITLRNYVACRNATAGLEILQGKIDEAAACYKETLAECKKYLETDEIHTDLMQLIHCNYNLLSCEGMKPGLFDASFLQEIQKTLDQETEEFLDKSKKNLEKAITNCFMNDIPPDLMDDSFRIMLAVATNLNNGIAVDVETSFILGGNEDVNSVFQFSDHLQDLHPKSKPIVAFKKSLQVCSLPSL